MRSRTAPRTRRPLTAARARTGRFHRDALAADLAAAEVEDSEDDPTAPPLRPAAADQETGTVEAEEVERPGGGRGTFGPTPEDFDEDFPQPREGGRTRPRRCRPQRGRDQRDRARLEA